ncbi:hypothetical protein SsS58_04176 [Streptomyces scabiei]|uniref:Uncharacterized protein n=1 Tax=Streptomyces scabiei TaxID=1930 RepID=A0A100JQF4_STRSC|nr:hypothetical protein SsS58_04176 [Streptomyces scabiei]
MSVRGLHTVQVIARTYVAGRPALSVAGRSAPSDAPRKGRCAAGEPVRSRAVVQERLWSQAEMCPPWQENGEAPDARNVSQA